MSLTEMNLTEMKLETIRIDQVEPGIVLATLDRDETLNSMTKTMFVELEQLALASDQDDAIRVLIITGSGRAFCSGYDLDAAEELPGLSAMAMLRQQEVAARGLAAIRHMRIPVIAAINGAASGGGLSLALSADMRIGSRRARFNAAFVRIGLSAGDLGASWLLTRMLGPGIAAEVAYTGRFVEAEEAYRLGLLNKLTSEEGLIEESVKVARLICANSPVGVQLSKRALQANMEVGSLAAALELENRGQALLTRGQDLREALEAIKGKRPPSFNGR